MATNGSRVTYDGWLLLMSFTCHPSNVKSNINSRRNRKRSESKHYASLINFLWTACLTDPTDLKHWILDFSGCSCWGSLTAHSNVLGCTKDGEIKGRIGFICTVGSCASTDSTFKLGRWFAVRIAPELDWSVECITKLGSHLGQSLYLVPCYMWQPESSHPSVITPHSTVVDMSSRKQPLRCVCSIE